MSSLPPVWDPWAAPYDAAPFKALISGDGDIDLSLGICLDSSFSKSSRRLLPIPLFSPTSPGWNQEPLLQAAELKEARDVARDTEMGSHPHGKLPAP